MQGEAKFVRMAQKDTVEEWRRGVTPHVGFHVLAVHSKPWWSWQVRTLEWHQVPDASQEIPGGRQRGATLHKEPGAVGVIRSKAVALNTSLDVARICCLYFT